MGRINWGRVVGGGLLAGLVASVLEMAYGFAMRAQWQEFLKGKEMPMQSVAAHFLWSFVVGIASVWLYAAIRPRYGPGPATAARAGFAVWLFVHATFALATVTLGVFPAKLMAIGAAWTLIETIVATLAGAAVYREP